MKAAETLYATEDVRIIYVWSEIQDPSQCKGYIPFDSEGLVHVSALLRGDPSHTAALDFFSTQESTEHGEISTHPLWERSSKL
jgi:hypothetical protein